MKKTINIFYLVNSLLKCKTFSSGVEADFQFSRLTALKGVYSEMHISSFITPPMKKIINMFYLVNNLLKCKTYSSGVEADFQFNTFNFTERGTLRDLQLIMHYSADEKIHFFLYLHGT